MSSKSELLNKLFVENGLSLTEDVYVHKHYKIITRTGIDKIMAKNNITISYKVEAASEKFCIVSAVAEMEGLKVNTLSSASDGTSTSKYYAEMAEKRAKSRCVLMLTGLYSHGVYGEDEADSFSKDKQ